jgi:propionyl-CoA carboxylase beta chain
MVAAQRGFIDDVIDPADTRHVICQELEILRTKNVENPPRKHSNVPL